ncbi:MAG: glycosyltransferase family 1 protein [Betaproteobacteria bacterium]|nr:MAG: glycosyltransferase family 1 protein [Betaproteobacteria bacterium]
MKLAFVTGSLVHGGAERHTITLANRLAERGHECHLAYVKNDPSQLERLRGAASVRCLDARRYLDFESLKKLRIYLRELRPSHIVAVNQYALMYAWLARPAGVPLAATFHTTELRTAKERLKMLWYRPLFRSAHWMVFVCEAQRRYWAARGVFGRRTDVIHNGVDTRYWTPVPEETRHAVRRALGLAERELLIGMSAVLRPEKNPVQLVEAIARLRRRGVPARGLLIGDGPTRPGIEARARRLGVEEQVVITGLQRDVRPLVGACDAVALCSTAVETFSLSALEAMALGKPVVQSEIGGASEMTQAGHDGFLFPPGDTPALVERLAALADPELRGRMGANARAAVERRFGETAMVDRYEQTLKELDTLRSNNEHVRKPAGAH